MLDGPIPAPTPPVKRPTAGTLKVLIASPGQAVSVSTGRVASSPVTPGKGWVTAAPAGLMAGAVMVAGRARVRSAVAVDHCEIAPSLDASC
jgi:hypothetical protein